MASKSDKIDVGGQEDFRAKLAAMKAEDMASEEGESGKKKAGKKVKEGVSKKKRKPRVTDSEAAARAEREAAVLAMPEIIPSEPMPPEAALPKKLLTAEDAAEKLVKASGFSEKTEELPKAASSGAVGQLKKEKNIELWQKPSLREQVTKDQKEAVEQFLEKQKGYPLSCLDEMLRILSAKKNPEVFNNEKELSSALEKAKLWLVGSRKIFDVVKINTPEAQIRKIYKKMSDNGEHDFTGDYDDKIMQVHQEVLAQMENRLAGVRRGLMKKYPGGLVVRGGEVKVNDHKEKRANLDSNASLFLFNEILGFGKKDASEEEKKYFEKTSYIKYDEQPTKGGIHLDISPRLQGAWIKNDELYFDHHGESSPRKSSAAETIYRCFEKGHLVDHLDRQERSALDRLIKFTAVLDSYVLPTGLAFNWRTVWGMSDKTLFGAALFFQNELPVEDLFNFFKNHELEDAFVRPLDGLKDSSLTRINQLRKDRKVGESKEVIQNFFQILNGPNAPKAKVVKSRLGKIVVMAQESREDKFPPGFQAAALAQGFDGILTWEPRSHKWFLAVGEQQKITKELADSIGEGEWVRESMIKKEASKDAGISLGELLEKLGVDLKNLEVYDGALAQAINRDKKIVTKIKPVPAPEAAVTPGISVPTKPESPTKESAATTVVAPVEIAPTETAPTEATRPATLETSSAAAPLPPTAPTEVIAPTLEKAAEVINVDTAENALTSARQEYIEIYQDFLRFKGKPNLISRLRKGVRGLFKGNEEAIMAELDENAREEIMVAREKYLQTKVNYAKALYQEEARLLAQEGKSSEEIAEALKQFGQQEIFEKLVIGEEMVLQAACAAEWPPAEKGLLRRGFEVWVKMPLPARLLITTGVLTGALYAGGAIGVGAVAATFGVRLARSAAGAIFGKGASELVGKFLSKRIAKETGVRTEEARGEMGIALANEKFDALNILTEKYHKIFEDKVKKEKTKLLAQTMAAIGAGVGASLGLGWLADAYLGAGAQPEKVSARASSATPTAGEGKGFEQTIADMKARGQNLVDELTKQAQEATEAARLEHVNELALLNQNEGIIHVVSRQLEDDPLRFGYSGNLEDAEAVHKWARHLAGQISIKEGYWDPSQNTQKWFVYNPAKPMHFVLSGDAEKGFHIEQSGEARSFIHTGDTKISPQQKYLDWDDEKASTAQPSDIAPAEPTVAEYSGRPLHWETWTEPVRGHMHMLAEELKASHELALQYATDPNLHSAALAVEQDVLKKIVEYQNAIKAHDVSGYDQELKDGFSWDDYHEAVKSELDKEVWKHAASHAGSGGGGVTRVENVAAATPEVPASGSATTAATEAVELARISKNQFLNTSLFTSDRIDALKEMMAGRDLKLDNIFYHQVNQDVRVQIGGYSGWVDEKNIDILKDFHKQFKGIATPGAEATAGLVEKLQEAAEK